ncbi:MAG: S-layer family protein [Cyanobacteria bacterium P01_A01_bin.105]
MFLFGATLGLAGVGSGFSANAQTTQVAGDGTAGTLVNASPGVICTSGSCNVTGGTPSGISLFHSFDKLSLQSGDEIVFDSTGVNTIFARVTGASSLIDGKIRTSGSAADLFVLNPQGIVFGENAVLDLDGSFFATTAEHIVFDNGAVFSASDGALSSSLLTVSVPVGVQYGANPGDITVQGPGHQLTAFFPSGPFNRAGRPNGLQVDAGQSLVLLGGPVTLAGGNLTAADGQVMLGSVGGGQRVGLDVTGGAWTLDYSGVSDFHDIQLTAAASVEVTGASGGAVQLRGQHLDLEQGAVVIANNAGAGTGGGIQAEAEAVTLQGSQNGIVSGFYNDVEFAGLGQTGTIDIVAQQLRLLDQGKISSTTYGAGSTGNITLQAGQLTQVGDSFVVSSAFPGSSGNSGDIDIRADQLLLSGGAQVATSNFGSGTAGKLAVSADQIVLTGGSTSTDLRSGFQAQGFVSPGGEVWVSADQIDILDGALITASTFGPAPGGQVMIVADRLTASGVSSAGDVSGVSASVLSVAGLPAATGDGGDVTLILDELSLVDGAQVTAATFADGNAGDLTVTAESIDLVGRSDQGRSGLFTSAIQGSGNGGNLVIEADRVQVREGAVISASNFQSLNLVPPGQGAAGNVRVNARSIALADEGTITAATAAGDQGNLFLTAETLTLQRDSRITTDAQGSSTGGNITIDAIALVATDNSDISANAQQGPGGRVVVNANLILGTAFRPQLTPDSDITASSELGPAFSGVVEVNTANVDADSGLTELPAALANASQQVAQQCFALSENSFVVSGRGGIPIDPIRGMPSQALWLDGRLEGRSGDPSAEAAIEIAPGVGAGASPLDELPASLIEAAGVRFEGDQVTLVATAEQGLPTPTASGCTQPAAS